MPIRRVGTPLESLFQLVADKKAKAPAALIAAGLVLEAATKEELSRPGRGRIRASGRQRIGMRSFRRGKDGKLHMVRRGAARTNIDVTDRASLPGDPPAPDTGVLRNSITHEIVTPNLLRVGTSLEYAAPLEFGTTRIAPRPFIRPAFAKARGQMSEALIATLRESHGQ